MAGAINLALFDKTGTLTEDKFDFVGVHEADFEKNDFQELRVTNFSSSTELIMAACHSLGVVNGKIVGDPLDLEIFNHSDSKADVPIVKVPKKNIFAAFATSFAANFAAAFTASVGNAKISQLKQYPFSSELARQSVLVKIEQDEGFDSVQILTKGAPETLKLLCRMESIPKDFDEKLEKLSKQGFRTLAMAIKKLQPEFYQTSKNLIDGAMDLSRDEIESNLQFIGFITFKNNLKPSSAEVIKQLEIANLKSIMVTGDNLETAISVSQEVGIIDPSHQFYVKTMLLQVAG